MKQKAFPFPSRHDLFHGSVLITPLSATSSRRDRMQLQELEAEPRCTSSAPGSFQRQGHKSAPEGKETGRKGHWILGVASETRFRGWESDLDDQGRAGPSLSRSYLRAPLPSRPEKQDPHRVGGAKPRDSRGPRSLWDAEEGGGLPERAQVSTAAPPSSGERASFLGTAGRGAGTFESLLPRAQPRGGPARLPESPVSRSQSPRAALKCLSPAAPDSLPSRTLSLPPTLLRVQ